MSAASLNQVLFQDGAPMIHNDSIQVLGKSVQDNPCSPD